MCAVSTPRPRAAAERPLVCPRRRAKLYTPTPNAQFCFSTLAKETDLPIVEIAVLLQPCRECIESLDMR